MDPQACLERLTEAYANGDNEEVVYAAGDLIDWIVKGGHCELIVTERHLLDILSTIVEA